MSRISLLVLLAALLIVVPFVSGAQKEKSATKLGPYLGQTEPRGSQVLESAMGDVIKQKQQNIAWERAARDEEAKLVASANQFYSKKNFDKAADLYRKALSIRYEQWRFGVGTFNGVEVPTAINRRTSHKLDTANTLTARERLGTIDEAIKKEAERSLNDQMTQAFQQVDAAALRTDTPKACAILSAIIDAAEGMPDSRTIQQHADKARRKMKDLLAPAYKALDAMDKLLKDKKTDEAFAAFLDFRKQYNDYLKFSDDLSARADAISKTPEIAQLVLEQDAGTQLAVAEMALSRQDYGRAMQAYRQVMTQYAGTEVAREAAARLAHLENDPAVQAALARQQTDDRCRALLSEVENFRRKGDMETARVLCQRIMDDYPDTEWGRRAADVMAALKK